MTSETIDYYNTHAQQFFDRTVSADLSEQYKMFVSMLSAGGSILDLGCGSGRDAKYFMDQGFKIQACDGAIELVRLASAYIGAKTSAIWYLMRWIIMLNLMVSGQMLL